MVGRWKDEDAEEYYEAERLAAEGMMIKEEVERIPRVGAEQFFAESNIQYNQMDVARLESLLNLEWWRGYHAERDDGDFWDDVYHAPAVR